jgi:hypothetical protein
MSHTKNGRLIGQAAHVERREQANYIADMQEAERKRKHEVFAAERAYIARLGDAIIGIIGRSAYHAWWQCTPDDNAGFIAALEAKHAELMPCECSADDRDGACPSCRARNTASEMPF